MDADLEEFERSLGQLAGSCGPPASTQQPISRDEASGKIPGSPAPRVQEGQQPTAVRGGILAIRSANPSVHNPSTRLALSARPLGDVVPKRVAPSAFRAEDGSFSALAGPQCGPQAAAFPRANERPDHSFHATSPAPYFISARAIVSAPATAASAAGSSRDPTTTKGNAPHSSGPGSLKDVPTAASLAPKIAPAESQDGSAGVAGDRVSSEGVKAPSAHLRAVAGTVWIDDTLDDWPENDYRLMVTNLGNDANDALLYAAFKHYPSVAKARVVREKHTNKCRGYGFVSFLAPLELARALREMGGKHCGSRAMIVKRCHRDKREFQTGSYGEDVDAEAARLLRAHSFQQRIRAAADHSGIDYSGVGHSGVGHSGVDQGQMGAMSSVVVGGPLGGGVTPSSGPSGGSANRKRSHDAANANTNAHANANTNAHAHKKRKPVDLASLYYQQSSGPSR